MKKISIFLMLCLAFVGMARAQQALPYEYGFETSLSSAGWSSTTTSSNSGLLNNPHSGSAAFGFCYNEGADRYLMSPILTGGENGIDVVFYYSSYNTQWYDQFQVGYTTDATVTDPSAFTYGETIAEENAEWTEYSNTFPAGTVRIAIKYLYNNGSGYYLFLDDFTFEAHSDCAKPTDLAVAYTEGESTATVTWSGRARGYNVEVNGQVVAQDVTETSYTINRIEPNATYTVRVQANCGGELSNWVATSFFSGCLDSYAIPYAYSFEDANILENCWTMDGDNLGASTDFPRTGVNCFVFGYTQNPPQYLISPLLSGIRNGLHVEFYYRQYTSGEETFHVGYSTTDNDPDSFTWGEEFTASSSYQRFSANYPAETKYVAVKYTSDYQWYLWLDDFLFEESASCLEPTAVTASDETTTGATISWTAGGEESAWDIYVTDNYEDVPDETTTPTVANTSNNPENLSSLTPATTYYVYVRAICDQASAWSSPAVFNTKCEGMDLPYSTSFEEDLSVCWTLINTNTSYNNIGLNTLPHEGELALGFNTQTNSGTLIAVLPVVSTTYPLNNAQISFWVRHYSSSSYASANPFAVGIMTDPNDESTFVQIGETITPTTTYTEYQIRLNGYTGNGQYIALKSTPNSTYNVYTFIDDIEVSVLPSCLDPENVTVDGGANAVVTWDGDGESFDVAISTEELDDPAEAIVGNTEENEFDLSDYTFVGDNYIYVRANCGTEGFSPWVGVYLDVNYCTPNPSSHDGNGITGVTFGTGDYVVENGGAGTSIPASAPYYGDYTSMIGAVQAGVESTIAITTGTGSYPYTFVIWVDLDNSLSFEDSEILYIGKASSGAGTLNATITVPATQATGDYRMRIYGADSYFTSFYNNGNTNWDAAHDPCAAGTWRHANDYTLRVLEAPSCLAAGDVTVAPESITSTSAVISWTNNNGEEATYTVMQGETVLTTTAVDSYQLTGLTAATSYPAGTYTIISDCDETLVANVPAFTTLCDVIVVTESWSEGFENGLSVCWDQEGSGTWSVGTGDYSTSTGAHTGTYNAKITHSDYDNVTKLITPVLDLTALNNPKLTFWYINRSWSGDIDGFTVYYRTASDAAWTQIDATSEEHATWTEATYSLPNPSATYQIAFEMYDNYGYGVGIDDITIEEAPVYTLTINGYTSAANGWNLIASPVATSPDAVENMISNTYDLYRYNATAQMEWENYQQHQGDFDIVPGQGYLYANSETVELGFSGDLYDGNGEITLENAGWNLVGNPFYDAIASIGRDYYRMNSDHDGLIAGTVDETINAWEGIFVEAENPGEVLTFTPVFKGEKSTNSAMVINLSQNSVIDRAIVRFGGNSMTKFQLFENSTKLYIAQDGEDYAIVNSGNEGEMPVNFKAEKNGTYTISVNTENVSMDYLHLIDNMTGADIDLLANPSYTFNASTTDYASRFRLVFAAAEVETFAYYNGSEWVVNGNGTMQLVDMMGRVLSSENVNGVATVNTNELSAGVYVMRLVNGNNVKTQKIVVK
jgi:hypothetical protein